MGLSESGDAFHNEAKRWSTTMARDGWGRWREPIRSMSNWEQPMFGVGSGTRIYRQNMNQRQSDGQRMDNHGLLNGYVPK